jgi:hypothetical protein
MTRYIIVSVISGILFGIMDALINANPLARRLYKVYRPITRTTLNPAAGFIIDLVYGFAMAGVFLVLYDSLPGGVGLIKGISFAGILWFFRVIMNAASQWIMFTVPFKSLVYSMLTGLGEMLVLGILYGLVLIPIL